MAKSVIPGLYIKVVRGREYWIGRVQRKGKKFERSFGRCDSVPLARAKQLLVQWLASEPETGSDHPVLLFSEAWRRAIDDIALLKQWRSPKSRSAWERSFLDAEPALGNKPLWDITTADIVACLQSRWLSHPESASRCRMRLEALFAWALTRGYCESNPAVWRGGVDQFLPPKAKVRRVKHHEAPSLPELQKVVAYCRRHPSPVSNAILFGIATVGRVSEWLMAEESEIQGDTWVMPAARRKDGRDYPHRVPLSSLASESLANRRRVASESHLLFTATGKPLAIDSPRMKLRMIVGRDVTMHGVRSTFRDWCALTGVPDVLAEKSLSHRWGNEVTEAYLRSDLLEQRRPVLEAWAAAVTAAQAP